ncbi:MAG: DUF885 family protein [Candidatus Omnitrophota bacterium]
MEEKRAKLDKLAGDYFDFMARAYPVMSLSDEFYFFPRAEEAVKYLRCLDSLDEEKIKQDVSYVRILRQRLEKLNIKEAALETQIDKQFLKQSMNGFIREFEQVKVWQNDPNLYLKIAVLGIEQVINKLSAVQSDIREELASRMKQIARLLNEAKVNLKGFSHIRNSIAILLAQAEIEYLKSGFSALLAKKGVGIKKFEALIGDVIRSLADFDTFLRKRGGGKEFPGNRELLEYLLTGGFSYKRSLEEIFEIASEEYQKTKLRLKKTARFIHPSKSWQRILSEYKLKAGNKKQLLNLYSGQILSLKNFFIKYGFADIPGTQNIQVEQTPVYLEPIRASASYSCPLTNNPKEPAFFYVSTGGVRENIHQEYIFVTAHETYPGHHLLDSIRRNIKNPIRRQIESPLFYEGWASYAERLVDEFGYLKDSRQKLIGLRRQAWRAIRAKIDAGIRINRTKLSGAEKELRWLGYSPPRAKAMLQHYLLTPGYQLCYTIGKFEIERLRKKFAPKIGINNFHNYLLAAGQIPFDLIEKRMQNLCQANS